MRQWIVRSKGSERKRSCNGLFELPCIAQGSNQSMMGFELVGVDSERGAKALGCLRRIAGSKLLESLLRKLFGLGEICLGHGFH